MKLSIIIVNYNTRDLLRDCLNSIIRSNPLKDQLSSNYEVIVVDNASTDASVAMLKKEFPQVKLFQNKQNLGFAKANNQGIKIAKGKYLLLLNSDTKIVAGALEKMIDFMGENPQVGVLGPKLLNKDGSLQPSAGYFPSLPVIFRQALFLHKIFPFNHLKQFKVTRPAFYAKTHPVDWVAGACFLVKNDVFAKIGYLDEKFFMYVEEVEFCYRCQKAGWQIYLLPQAKITHQGEGSGDRQKAILGIYQGLFLFYDKHKSGWQKVILKVILKTAALLRITTAAILGKKTLKSIYQKAYQLI